MAAVTVRAKGDRKTSTIPTVGDALSVGQKFTIAGCGWGAKGQEVTADFNPKTKRRCKCVRLREYRVTGIVT